jgi:hypothetical protein
MLRREAWSGGSALLAGPFPFVLAGPSPFLLADLSLFFPKFTANYPELRIKFYRVSETRTGFGQPKILLSIPVPGRDVHP